SEAVKTCLDTKDVAQMEEAARSQRDRILVRLLFRLGCRVSEAVALSADDVHLEASAVTLQHLKLRVSISCPACGARLSRGHRSCPACGSGVERAVQGQLSAPVTVRAALDPLLMWTLLVTGGSFVALATLVSFSPGESPSREQVRVLQAGRAISALALIVEASVAVGLLVIEIAWPFRALM
ncbi:MAG: hypothetical protein Q8O40_14340, partial [Chloroflexota bacterium]|nr:hypothetical protein [Chloroflexota bacterium]